MFTPIPAAKIKKKKIIRKFRGIFFIKKSKIRIFCAYACVYVPFFVILRGFLDCNIMWTDKRQVFARNMLLLFVMAFLSTGCEKNTDVNGSPVKTYENDSIRVSYYVTDNTNVATNAFAANDGIRIHIDVQNKCFDTLLVHTSYFGQCYNSANQNIEELSMYNDNDTLPIYKQIIPGGTACFQRAFILAVPRGMYHYEAPYVSVYTKGDEYNVRMCIIPLTLNFRIQ